MSSSLRQVPSRVVDLLKQSHYINGAYTALKSSASRPNLSPICPIDKSPLPECANGDTADVNAAVKSAQEGFEVWKQYPNHERARLLRAVVDSLENSKSTFAEYVEGKIG